MSFLVKRLFKINVPLETSVLIFLQCEWDLLELLFTAVLPKRLYKTHTQAFIIILETRHTSLIMASLNVLVKLLPSSPFRLSLCFFIGVHRFLSAFLSFLSWARLALSISFCNLGFIGCHVFDIRSGHIHFQGQYSQYFFSFVCSIFLVVFFAFVVFAFNAFVIFSCIRFRDFSLTRESTPVGLLASKTAIPRAACFPILSSQYHFTFQVAIP